MANDVTVQDIFLKFYPEYLTCHTPNFAQQKVATNIMNCKTGAYGLNVSICEDCGAIQIHYNSCRNRCCPMCQTIPKELWMDARREDVLDEPLSFTQLFTASQFIYNFYLEYSSVSSSFRQRDTITKIPHLPVSAYIPLSDH